MSDVINVFFLFLVFASLLSSIRFLQSQFSSFLILTLTVVSFYAVIRTGFYSFYTAYLVSFLAWIGYWLKTKHLKLRFSFQVSDVVIGLILWSLFALVYLDFTEFYILHPGNTLDDIGVYSRIAYYNDLLGVENTRGIYNLFNLYPKIELYHHFELWMMNLGHFFNGASRSMNLLLFVFPLISFLCFIGIRETFNFNSWTSLALLIIFFLVIWPYDFLVNWLDLGLPKGGVGAIILGIKNVLVLPIILAVIIEFRQKSTHFYLTAVSLFLYPLLIPLVSVSLIVYVFFFSKYSIKHLWAHFSLILVILVFMALIPNSHPGLDIYGVFNFEILQKVVYVSVVTPLISFGFYWILFIKKIGFGKLKELILFFSISLALSIVFWILFNRNIDSNQFFRNLFIPLCSFSIAVAIVVFFTKRLYAYVITGILVFLVPVFTIIGKSKMNHPSEELLSIAARLDEGDRVMFFPDPNVVNSVFMYNERMFLSKDISLLGNFFEDVHLLGTVTLLNSQALERNGIAKEMIDYYKSISPLFDACGDSQTQEQCIREFATRFDFQKCLIHKNSPFASAFKPEVSFRNYFLVDL